MEKRFLSIAEAARYSSLSQRFLYQLVHDRKLRHYRIGRRVVLAIADIDSLINEGCQEVIDWNEKAKGLR